MAHASRNSQRTVLTSNEVQQGNILWLAPYSETTSHARQRGCLDAHPVRRVNSTRLPDEGFYNHPILVLSRPVHAPDRIYFLHLTTFGNQNISKRFKKGASLMHWPKYMAIAPSPHHPLFDLGHSAYATLTLEGGVQMAKRGYVRISEVYTMNWQDAQPYWGAQGGMNIKAKLDAKSLKAVLTATAQIAGYIPGEQYDPAPKQSPPGNEHGLNVVDLLAFDPCRGLVEAVLSAGTITANREEIAAPARNAESLPHPSLYPSHRFVSHCERQPLLPRDNNVRTNSDASVEKGWLSWMWLCFKRMLSRVSMMFVSCCLK